MAMHGLSSKLNSMYQPYSLWLCTVYIMNLTRVAMPTYGFDK